METIRAADQASAFSQQKRGLRLSEDSHEMAPMVLVYSLVAFSGFLVGLAVPALALLLKLIVGALAALLIASVVVLVRFVFYRGLRRRKLEQYAAMLRNETGPERPGAP
jgi:hypothetical protein